jgi:hypothetical protein
MWQLKKGGAGVILSGAVSDFLPGCYSFIIWNFFETWSIIHFEKESM